MKSWRVMPRVSKLMKIEGNIRLIEISTISYNESRWYMVVGVGKVKRY
jgi:hypothetical protein